MGLGAIKDINDGPAYLAASATDIYTPPASTIITYIGQIHLANKTSGSVSATVYRGLTGGSAGGTELIPTVTISANSTEDFYFSPPIAMPSTRFLSGLASAGSSITITVLGYQNTTP